MPNTVYMLRTRHTSFKQAYFLEAQNVNQVVLENKSGLQVFHKQDNQETLHECVNKRRTRHKESRISKQGQLSHNTLIDLKENGIHILPKALASTFMRIEKRRKKKKGSFASATYSLKKGEKKKILTFQGPMHDFSSHSIQLLYQEDKRGLRHRVLEL